MPLQVRTCIAVRSACTAALWGCDELSRACSSRNLEWLEARLDAHEAADRAQAAAEARRARASACAQLLRHHAAFNTLFLS